MFLHLKQPQFQWILMIHLQFIVKFQEHPWSNKEKEGEKKKGKVKRCVERKKGGKMSKKTEPTPMEGVEEEILRLSASELSSRIRQLENELRDRKVCLKKKKIQNKNKHATNREKQTGCNTRLQEQRNELKRTQKRSSWTNNFHILWAQQLR